MRIAIIGTGYVGLVSGACFSDFGHDVVCVDKDEGKIAALEARSHADLRARPRPAGRAQRRRAAGSPSPPISPPAVAGAEAIFIAVGTPSRRGDGHADLSYVYGAAREIGRVLNGPAVVVTKSTVPVGTGDEVERILREVAPGRRRLRSSPTRNSCARARRSRISSIPTGSSSAPRTTAPPRSCAKSIGRSISTRRLLLFTSRRTAELIKYAANAFLATKITFINEIADLCEAVGGEVQDVARGIGLDGRIGSKFLHAGPGYGGSCFPKDTLALLKTAEDAHAPLRIVEAVVKVNDARKRAMGRKVIKALGDEPRGKIVALLGLAFKPNTDDMRDAPSLSIVQALEDAGVTVRGYDPESMEQARPLMPNVALCARPYEAARGRRRGRPGHRMGCAEGARPQAAGRRRCAAPVLVDLRNIYPPEEVEEAGLAWHGIGRPAAAMAGARQPASRPAR